MLLEMHGIEPDDELLARFEETLHRTMVARAGELAERGRAMPGALEALERLSAEPDVLQSLLTGNIQQNARVKLEPFGLDRHLEIEIGGYGSDHRVRGELVAIARERAERKHSVAIQPGDVVLVGDTPLDVDAARHGGARAVGVATGPFGEEELREAGADAVLADLSDVELVMRSVLA